MLRRERNTCAERDTAHVTNILMGIAVVIYVACRKCLRTQLNFVLRRIGRRLGGLCRVLGLCCLGSYNVA